MAPAFLLVASMSALAASGEEAFRLALRADLAEAAAAADEVLAGASGDATALLVLVCVAVERGDLARAEALAARLEQAGSPRGPVARRLVERRRARPSEPMRDALVEAWKVAGRPDLGRDVPPDVLRDLLPPLSAAVSARLSAAEQLALAGMTSGREDGLPSAQSSPEAELAVAAKPERNPFWVNLLLLRQLEPREGDSSDRKLRRAEAERRVARALAAADPGNGYWAMVGVLAGGVPMSAYDGAGGASPFGEAELAALEAAVAAPRFEWPWRRFRLELRDRLRAIDPAHADVRASMRTWMTLPLYTVALQHRARATVDLEVRERAARALAGVGRRLRSGPLLFDRLLSAAVEGVAAELAGDARAEAEVRAAGATLSEWSGRTQAARERLGIWPLVSVLREEVAEDEMAYLQRLVE